MTDTTAKEKESLLKLKPSKRNCKKLTNKLPTQKPSAIENPVNNSRIAKIIATTIEI